jgi:TonB-dependent receptor
LLSTYQAFGSHGLGFEGDTRVDWVLSYSDSSQEEPDLRINNYKVNRLVNNYLGLSTADSDSQPTERIWRLVEDSNYTANLDISTPIMRDATADKETRLRLGGFFDSTSRDFRSDAFAYARNTPQGARDAGAVFRIPVTPDDRDGLTPADVLHPTAALERANGRLIYPFSRSEAATTYQAEQNTVAFSGAFEMDFAENFSMTAGARVEQFDLTVGRDFTGFELDAISRQNFGVVNVVTFDLDTGVTLPEAEIIAPVEISTTDMLPVLSADWDFAENMKLRGVISRTLARPSFKEIAPVFTRELPGDDVFAGNRDLVPSDVVNYDVRWEWYPERGDMVAASFFAKSIASPIELRQTGSLNFFVNEESASLYGFEVEVQKGLDDFAEALDDVSVGFNFAKIASSVDLSEESAEIRRRVGLPLRRPLQGQPDYTFNFNVSYDDEDRGIYAGLFLNVTGQLVYATGGQQGEIVAPDILQRPFTTLNFTFSKQLSDHWTFNFKATNLTAEKRVREYERGSTQSITNSGVGFSVGFSGEW